MIFTTFLRFINITREVSTERVRRVDQILQFENISTELAGKKLNCFNTSKCLAMQIIVLGTDNKGNFMMISYGYKSN